MKRLRQLAMITLTAVLLCAPALGQSSDPDSKILTKSFANSTTISLKTTASLPHLTSVVMVFPGGAQTITWKINIIRDGKTIEVVDYTDTGTTFILYLPNWIHLQSNDQIYIETGVGASAVVWLSEQF